MQLGTSLKTSEAKSTCWSSRGPRVQFLAPLFRGGAEALTAATEDSKREFSSNRTDK